MVHLHGGEGDDGHSAERPGDSLHAGPGHLHLSHRLSASAQGDCMMTDGSRLSVPRTLQPVRADNYV